MSHRPNAPDESFPALSANSDREEALKQRARNHSLPNLFWHAGIPLKRQSKIKEALGDPLAGPIRI
jgi:hypothetical protein